MRKAQTFSTDAIIAVVIFLFISISVLYIVGNLSESRKFEQLTDEGELVAEGITSSKIASILGFLEGRKIDKNKLGQFANMSYSQLKSIFGMSADFCIHIEDDEGYLINVTENITGIGSPKAKVSGVKCTTKS